MDEDGFAKPVEISVENSFAKLFKPGDCKKLCKMFFLKKNNGFVKMAKPIEYVTLLSEDEARKFIKKEAHPAPNPGRDKLIAAARKLKLSLDAL